MKQFIILVGGKMKTEEDVLKEIEATKRTMDNYKNVFKNGDIPEENFRYMIADCQGTLDALMWVLGKNDRYD